MKYALVTGGSRGIGRATCLKLAELDYHILINYRSNDEEAEKTLNLIKEQGGSGEFLKFDVANKEQVNEVIEAWLKSHPDEHIEVLVNNAGIRKDGLMMWMPDEDWSNVISTNLDSFFYVTKAVLTKMLGAKYGRIINVVSLSGVSGMPGQANYSAAKAGVIGATKALAQEVARRNVTVNAIAPGFIKTDMVEDLDEANYKKMVPMRRFGKAEEVADLIAFIASSKSSYITGEVISIDGGLPS